MADQDNLLTQLVTRIPARLRRRLKIHCVETDSTLTAFVIEAIEQRLRREEGRRVVR